MQLIRPRTWAEALEAHAQHPGAVPIQGGTDVMVGLNFGRARPDALLDLSGIAETKEWSADGARIRLGGGVTYARVIDELARELPGLAIAARTVGSPQIRNRGTIAGNLGTASPAGDAHPALLAARAVVELASTSGSRHIAIDEFYVGPKRNVLRDDELIAAVHIPVATGRQQFAKVGTRNAMVIAATSFALAIDLNNRRVGTGIGSAGPIPLRATAAERFLERALTDTDAWEDDSPVDNTTLMRFGELVASAAQPIDDVRATRDYRLHALAVLGCRTLNWTRSACHDLYPIER